jgi:hypothetical protein
MRSNTVLDEAVRPDLLPGAHAWSTGDAQHHHPFAEGKEAIDAAILVFVICYSLMAMIFYMGTIARLQRIERKLNALLRHQGVDPTQGLPLSDRVKELAGDPSRKIEAIKVYREETGASLAEAKEAVEAFMNKE